MYIVYSHSFKIYLLITNSCRSVGYLNSMKKNIRVKKKENIEIFNYAIVLSICC